VSVENREVRVDWTLLIAPVCRCRKRAWIISCVQSHSAPVVDQAAETLWWSYNCWRGCVTVTFYHCLGAAM
jgi:hypothetical protein